MKMKIKRVATDCISVEMNRNELHIDEGTAVMFLELGEAENAGNALFDGIQQVSADGSPIPVSEAEALDMLPEVQEKCNGSYGTTGMECDNCSRLKDDCEGSGEFL